MDTFTARSKFNGFPRPALWIAAVLSAAAILGCDGNDMQEDTGGTSDVAITGRLGPGYTTDTMQAKSQSSIANAVEAVVVDELWAIPVHGASLSRYQFDSIVRGITFDDEGKFYFEPDQESDYLLVLVYTPNCYEPDDTAPGVQDIDTRLDCIRGYVTLTGDDGSTLTAIPTSVQTGPLDLGSLSYSPPIVSPEEIADPMSGDAIAETTLEAAAPSFDIDLGGLTTIDDLLRGAIYQYANFDADLMGWDMNLTYTWDTAAGLLASATTGFTAPEALTYLFYHYYMFSNIEPDALLASVGETPGYLTITPPGALTRAMPPMDIIASPSSPYEAAASSCTIDRGEFQYDLPYALAGMTTPGMWLVTKDGSVVAKYDLSTGAPFRRTSDGSLDASQPIMLAPSIKADVVDGRVNKLWFKWMHLRESTWEAVDPAAAMKSLGSAGVALYIPPEGASGECFENLRIESRDLEIEGGAIGLSLSGSTSGKSWTLDAENTSDCFLKQLAVTYDVSGVTYNIYLN